MVLNLWVLNPLGNTDIYTVIHNSSKESNFLVRGHNTGDCIKGSQHPEGCERLIHTVLAVLELALYTRLP